MDGQRKEKLLLTTSIVRIGQCDLEVVVRDWKLL